MQTAGFDGKRLARSIDAKRGQTVDRARHEGKSFDQLLDAVRSQCNVVLEMIATLAAVKPARKPGSMQPKPMRLEIQHVDIDPSKALL
jgi:hypothetical protein